MSRFTVAVSFLRKASQSVLIVRAAMGCGCRRASHDVASTHVDLTGEKGGGQKRGWVRPKRKNGALPKVSRAPIPSTPTMPHTLQYTCAPCVLSRTHYIRHAQPRQPHRLFCRCAPRTRSDRHARGTHPCVHYAPMMITPPPEPAAPHHRASRAHDTATRPERCTSSRPELAAALVGEQLGGGARVDRLGIRHHLPRLVLEHLGRERDRPVLGVHADHHAPHLVAHRQAVPR